MKCLAISLLILPLLFAVLVEGKERKPPKDIVIQVTRKIPANRCLRKTKKGDRLRAHYTGRLWENGEMFDSSYSRDFPAEFDLGGGDMIRGWDLGLFDMCIGESRKLILPPHLGYGDAGNGPVPGGATLIFDIKLLDILNEEPSKDDDDF